MHDNTLVVSIFNRAVNGIIYLYVMMRILVYLLFLISVAMAAGGTVISSKLRSRHHNEIMSNLLYFQVFIFAFGFYGIWGQVIIKAFLGSLVNEELISKICDISSLLGLPFLVFALLMLIRFSMEVSGRKEGRWFLIVFLLLNFLLLIMLGYYISTREKNTGKILSTFYIIMNFVYCLVSAALILRKEKSGALLNYYDRKIIATTLVLFMMLQCISLYLYSEKPFAGLFFILTFFVGNAFLPVYLNYCTFLQVFEEDQQVNLSLDEFCKKYDVSPRETDIIREICNGLSNKEISEKLFISLQTVKDHTHRIYTKTNARNRVQLINMIKG